MDFISNPNLPNILLKAERRDNLIAIQTYDRAHGRKGRFLICMDALQAWLDGDRERPFYDSDCGNFSGYPNTAAATCTAFGRM